MKLSQLKLSFTANTPFLSAAEITTRFETEVEKMNGFSLFLTEKFRLSLNSRKKLKVWNEFIGTVIAKLQNLDDTFSENELLEQNVNVAILEVEWLQSKENIEQFFEFVV
jgi:hypothetical protein